MQQLTILNNKEIKKIKQIVTDNFGHFPQEKYVILRNENNRIFLVDQDIFKINLKNLIIDKIGLYFAEAKNTQVRLSKEGAQLLGRDAKLNEIKLKNVLELTEEETKDYFRGNDLVKDLGEENKLILLKFKEDILGCAKYKEGKILNYLPKIHRGTVI